MSQVSCARIRTKQIQKIRDGAAWLGSDVKELCTIFGLPGPDIMGVEVSSLAVSPEKLQHNLESNAANNQFSSRSKVAAKRLAYSEKCSHLGRVDAMVVLGAERYVLARCGCYIALQLAFGATEHL